MITVNINIPNEQPFVLTQNDFIKSFSLLSECDSDISKVYSSISANELSITLINKDSVFSIENTESPLYNKIGNGTELEIMETLEGEPISRGKFYVADYDAPLNALSSTFSIRAVDALQAALNKSVSLEQIERKISVYDYFFKIFNSLGFESESLVVDESLKTIFLNFSVLNGKKTSELLNSLCLASDSMIYLDSKGRVQIKRKSITGTPIKHFTTQNIISLDIPKSLSYDNNMMKFGYTSTFLSDVQEILNTEIECVPGVSTISDIKLSKSNVYEIDNLKLIGSNVILSGCSFSQASISLTIDNQTTETQTTKIIVMGKTIETATAYITKKDDLSIAAVGEKALELVSESVQNQELAENLANTYWVRLTEKIPYVNLKTRSNSLQFDLCMICDVIEPTKAKLAYLGYVHSINYVWNGGDAFSVELGIKTAEGVIDGE